MRAQGMKEQDLVELYQLCRMYRGTYSGAGREAAEKLMQEAEREYRERNGAGDIAAARNPRKAGRKRTYKEESDRKIQELHEAGMSKRGIAKETRCSLGHVQDVLRR